MSTQKPGFYKLEGKAFFYAPTAIHFPGGTVLLASEHASYNLPIDGWHWFETESEARTALGAPEPEEPARKRPARV